MTAIAISLTALSCKNQSTEMVNTDIPDEIQTSLGVPFDVLKGDITEFILKTYMPSESDTKDDYVSDIVNYLSAEEYSSLISDLGDYYGDIKTQVSDLEIQYGLACNNTDNKDKILISFYLHKSANGIYVRNRINLVFTIQGDEIIDHSIYMGATEKRSN